MHMIIRDATVGDLPSVMNVLDGGLLAVAAPDIKGAVDDGDVLVCVTRDGGDGPVLGVLVLDGREISSVAVRRRRRGQGIGSRLVAAAAARRDCLVATFDERVEPFWESLGFDIEEIEGTNRLRGRLSGTERLGGAAVDRDRQSPHG